MARRGTSASGTKVERRKAARFLVSVPIEASWRGPDGIAVKEQAVAKQVNGHGGMLEMSTYPEIGSRISLTNFLSAETAEARVLATPSSREGVSHGIIVELIVPSEKFWGVNFQVKKTNIELQKLETALLSEGIDPRLLNEFRDAVDYARTISMIVQGLRERQLHGRDDEDVIAQLASERVRRTTNLCLEVIADLDSGTIKKDTKGVEELLQSVARIRDGLKELPERRDPDRRAISRK